MENFLGVGGDLPGWGLKVGLPLPTVIFLRHEAFPQGQLVSAPTSDAGNTNTQGPPGNPRAIQSILPLSS